MVAAASCCGDFFGSRNWETSDRKVNAAMYRDILDDNLLLCFLDLRLEKRLIFQ